MLDLVGLRQRVPRLKVENLGNVLTREDVVAALDPISETKPRQETAKLAETNIRIRGAPQHLQQDGLCHI